MKKLSCVFLLVLTLSLLCPMFVSSVSAAGNDEIIGQGVTLIDTPVYISDAKGWRQVTTVPAGQPIAVYFNDSDWVHNAPNQKMPRWIKQGWQTVRAVGIYGVDKVRETNWGSRLVASSGPLLIGEDVFAGPSCKKMSGPGYGVDFHFAPEGTLMRVIDKSDGWLFVFVNNNSRQPCWVLESSVRRGTAIVDGYVDETGNLLVMVGLPITNHLAGNGRAIAVTAEQAKEAVQLALQGRAGTLYTRADGRILVDIVRGGYRYIAFLEPDGQLGSFFPPAERHVDQISKAANYVNNVISKGGYWRAQASQIPQQIKDLWLPAVAGSSLVQQFLNLAQSEVFFLLFFAPADWNKYLGPQGPTKL